MSLGFDARQIYRNCGAYEPLDDKYLYEIDGKQQWSKPLPLLYVPNDKDYLLQIILSEFDFTVDCNPKTARRKTLFAITLPQYNPKRAQRRSDGSTVEWPVATFEIFSNRGLFRPKGEEEDELVYCEAISDRALCIAHEILAAKAFYSIYKLGDDQIPEIPVPTSDAEMDLVCSCETIEKLLHSAEKILGRTISTVEQFQQFEETQAGWNYTKTWLRQYKVNRSIVSSRTEEYLRKGKRDGIKSHVYSCLHECSLLNGHVFKTRQEFESYWNQNIQNRIEFQNIWNSVSGYEEFGPIGIYRLTTRYLRA